MKKLLALTPAALLLALAAGCSPNSTSAPPPKTSATPAGDHRPAMPGAAVASDGKS